MEYAPKGGTIWIHESDFPGCCAVAVAHQARTVGEGGGDSTKFNPEGMKEAVGQLVAGIGTECKPNLWLYALTEEQVTERDALLANGFEALKTFKSSTSRRTITLYGRVVEDAKRAPRARRRRRR